MWSSEVTGGRMKLNTKFVAGLDGLIWLRLHGSCRAQTRRLRPGSFPSSSCSGLDRRGHGSSAGP